MKYFKHDLDAHQNRKLWRLIKTHGMSGYGIWWLLLEALYASENDGFKIVADDFWLERFADLARLSDQRVLIRVFDTLAEVGLIDSQLWQEHVVYVPSVIERGDAYVQQKANNRERQRRYKQRERVNDALSQTDDVSVTQRDNALTEHTNTKSYTDPDPDSDLSQERVHAQEKKTEEHYRTDKEAVSSPSVESLRTSSASTADIQFKRARAEDFAAASVPRELLLDFIRQDRTRSTVTADEIEELKRKKGKDGKLCSCATDPWMAGSRFNPDPDFLQWLCAKRKKAGDKICEPDNVSSEIRNDFARAGTNWAEYQKSRNPEQAATVRRSLADDIDLEAIRQQNLERAKTLPQLPKL